MPAGISLHLGLSQVNEAHYFYLEPLTGAVPDALFMQQFAQKRKFATTLLTNESATRNAVISFITQTAAQLAGGDCFLLSYSGHGGQFPEKNYGYPTEKDGKDDTWCLYDEQLIDDELHWLFTQFAPGVRIIVVSDSCHSGTITRSATGINKTVLQNVQNKILKKHLELYKRRKKDALTDRPLSAGVLLLAACKEKEEALDLGFYGAFTNAFRICTTGDLLQSYNQLETALQQNMRQNSFAQTPALTLSGNVAAFNNGLPFKI